MNTVIFRILFLGAMALSGYSFHHVLRQTVRDSSRFTRLCLVVFGLSATISFSGLFSFYVFQQNFADHWLYLFVGLSALLCLASVRLTKNSQPATSSLAKQHLASNERAFLTVFVVLSGVYFRSTFPDFLPAYGNVDLANHINMIDVFYRFFNDDSSLAPRLISMTRAYSYVFSTHFQTALAAHFFGIDFLVMTHVVESLGLALLLSSPLLFVRSSLPWGLTYVVIAATLASTGAFKAEFLHRGWLAHLNASGLMYLGCYLLHRLNTWRTDANGFIIFAFQAITIFVVFSFYSLMLPVMVIWMFYLNFQETGWRSLRRSLSVVFVAFVPLYPIRAISTNLNSSIVNLFTSQTRQVDEVLVYQDGALQVPLSLAIATGFVILLLFAFKRRSDLVLLTAVSFVVAASVTLALGTGSYAARKISMTVWPICVTLLVFSTELAAIICYNRLKNGHRIVRFFLPATLACVLLVAICHASGTNARAFRRETERMIYPEQYAAILTVKKLGLKPTIFFNTLGPTQLLLRLITSDNPWSGFPPRKDYHIKSRYSFEDFEEYSSNRDMEYPIYFWFSGKVPESVQQHFVTEEILRNERVALIKAHKASI